MYIELTCNFCEKTFRINFTNNEYNTTKCPKCGKTINSGDVARIRTLTESFYANANRTSTVTICGIHAGANQATGSAIIAGDLFSSDMNHLEEIYNSSSPAVQNKLAALIDKFYLLVNHDAKAEKLDKLDSTLEQLQTIFMERVTAKQKEMAQALGLNPKD